MDKITFLISAVLVISINGQQPEIRPPNNAGTIGREAHIDCYTYNAPAETFEWREFATSDTTGGNLIYNSVSGIQDNRFDVQREGDVYKLIIKDVQPQLAGIYQCGFVGGDLRINGTFLAVSELECDTSEDKVVKGNEVTYTTTAYYHGHLSSETFVISANWYDQNDRSLPSHIEITNDYIRFNTTVEADHETDGQMFRGVLRLLSQPDELEEKEAFNENCSTSYSLLFPPENLAVDQEVDDDGRVGVREGDDIKCSADANPAATFEWFLHSDNSTVVGHALRATAEMIEDMVEATCTASNEHGEDSLTVQLIRYTSGGNRLYAISYTLLFIQFIAYSF